MSLHHVDLAERPIPVLSAPAGWRKLTIRECGEPLVALSGWAPARIAVDARYHGAGYPGALADCYVREMVACRLDAAAVLLPPGWRLIVLDAWRPLTVQQHLFYLYVARIHEEQPTASDATVRQQAARYVAPPSADMACPSPHATGCAVDLSVLDANGCPVDMGTEFDAFDSRAHTRFFETRLERGESLAPAEQAWLQHRRILFHALRAVGFVNYPEEWWHYEYDRSRFGPLLALGDRRVL